MRIQYDHVNHLLTLNKVKTLNITMLQGVYNVGSMKFKVERANFIRGCIYIQHRDTTSTCYGVLKLSKQLATMSQVLPNACVCYIKVLLQHR